MVLVALETDTEPLLRSHTVVTRTCEASSQTSW